MVEVNPSIFVRFLAAFAGVPSAILETQTQDLRATVWLPSTMRLQDETVILYGCSVNHSFLSATRALPNAELYLMCVSDCPRMSLCLQLK